MLILGDNQFLGVNHASPKDAADYGLKFKTAEDVADNLSEMVDVGCRHFCFTYAERYEDVFNILERRGQLRFLKLYPSIPYAHEIAAELATVGVSRYATTLLSKQNIFRIVKSGFSRGAFVSSLLSKYDNLRNYPQVETIFLLNVFVDFLIGLELLTDTLRQSEKKFEQKMSIFTYNPHLLSEQDFMECKFVSFSTNSIGFRSFPNLKENIRIGKKLGPKFIGMSIMASGMQNENAITWFKSTFPSGSLLLGTSKPKNFSNAASMEWD